MIVSIGCIGLDDASAETASCADNENRRHCVFEDVKKRWYRRGSGFAQIRSGKTVSDIR